MQDARTGLKEGGKGCLPDAKEESLRDNDFQTSPNNRCRAHHHPLPVIAKLN